MGGTIGSNRIFVALCVGCVVALLCHVGIGGHIWYSPGSILAEIARGRHLGSTDVNTVVWENRLPRALGCVLVGWLLGMVGSAFQALLRNRLADPYVIGVSSGAAVGGALAMVLGFEMWLGGLGMMVCGFATGLLSLMFVFAIGTRRGAVETNNLLLGGVVIGSLLSSLVTLVLISAGRDSNRVLQWLYGKVENFMWPQLLALFAILVVGSFILLRQTRLLNAYAMGEDTAKRLGVNVTQLRNVVLITGTAMTAAAVGSVGIIPFLGLAAPHIARRLVGVDWRISMAASGAVGAMILLVADLIAQRGLEFVGIPVMNLPVGIVTAIIGAPTLLVLLRSRG